MSWKKEFNKFGVKAAIMPNGEVIVMEKDTPREGVINVSFFSRISDFVKHPLASKVMIEDVEFEEVNMRKQYERDTTI